MILEPINDNIVVKLPEMEKEIKNKTGLIIGNVNKDMAKSDRGTVIAVGKGRITSNGNIVELSVKEGDEIIFNRFAGTEVVSGETRYLIIKESDILVRVK